MRLGTHPQRRIFRAEEDWNVQGDRMINGHFGRGRKLLTCIIRAAVFIPCALIGLAHAQTYREISVLPAMLYAAQGVFGPTASGLVYQYSNPADAVAAAVQVFINSMLVTP